MDAFINWAVNFVAAHPKVAAWLMVVLAVDQFLKMLKNALKLNIPDNVFDGLGDLLRKVIEKSAPPK